MSCPKGTKKPNSIGNKNALGNKGGRPRKCEVKDLPTLAAEMHKYFLGYLTNIRRRRDIPFLQDWCRSVGISPETIVKYAKDNVEFRTTYLDCKEIQKETLIKGGLQGYFNPSSFIFTAKNITDMRDRQEIEHSGGLDIDVDITKVIDKVYGDTN